MNHHLQAQRRIAAQAFLESLKQLGDQITAGSASNQPNQPPAEAIAVLEDAVTDIEHMLQDEQPSS